MTVHTFRGHLLAGAVPSVLHSQFQRIFPARSMVCSSHSMSGQQVRNWPTGTHATCFSLLGLQQSLDRCHIRHHMTCPAIGGPFRGLCASPTSPPARLAGMPQQLFVIARFALGALRVPPHEIEAPLSKRSLPRRQPPADHSGAPHVQISHQSTRWN